MTVLHIVKVARQTDSVGLAVCSLGYTKMHPFNIQQALNFVGNFS